MSGQITEQGSLSLAQVCPFLGLSATAINVSAGAAISEVGAKVTGLLNVVTALSLPQVPALAIAGAGQALLALEATVAVPEPVQLTAVLAALAELQASLVNLQAQLAFGVSLGELGSAPGIAGYTYSGTTDSLGPELGAHTSQGLPGGGPNDQCNAIILATTIPATWAAMAQVFGI